MWAFLALSLALIVIIVAELAGAGEFFDLVWLKIKVALESLMGYSARYHAASLAAVFLALAVGILIGVGFGSDIVNGTADDLEQSLPSDLDDAGGGDRRSRRASSPTSTTSPQAVPRRSSASRLRGRESASWRWAASTTRSRTTSTPPSSPPAAAARDRRGPRAARRRRAQLDRRRARRDAPSRGETSTSSAGSASARGRALVLGGPEFADLRAALFSRYSGQPGNLDARRHRPPPARRPRPRREAATTQIEDGHRRIAASLGRPRGRRRADQHRPVLDRLLRPTAAPERRQR